MTSPIHENEETGTDGGPHPVARPRPDRRDVPLARTPTFVNIARHVTCAPLPSSRHDIVRHRRCAESLRLGVGRQVGAAVTIRAINRGSLGSLG